MLLAYLSGDCSPFQALAILFQLCFWLISHALEDSRFPQEAGNLSICEIFITWVCISLYPSPCSRFLPLLSCAETWAFHQGLAPVLPEQGLLAHPVVCSERFVSDYRWYWLLLHAVAAIWVTVQDWEPFLSEWLVFTSSLFPPSWNGLGRSLYF